MKIGSLFSRQAPPMMGLDISASSLKLVELGQSGAGNFSLEHCGIEPLEQGLIVDSNIEKFDEVVDAMRRLVGKSGSKTKDVAMALPSSVVIGKRIILPGGLSEREMEVQVESEASQYIPFPLDDVNLDFCVAGPSASSDGDVEVVIAASRKEKVQEMQGLAEAAGLRLTVLDVENHASRRAARRFIDLLPGGNPDSVIVLFEIGAMTSVMHVLRAEELIYERDYLFGGARLTHMLVRQYGFTLQEAESKKRAGELPSDYATAVLAPYVDKLAHELERALKFFFTSTPHNRVDYILLAGGTATLAGLTEAVTHYTSFPCQIVNPFSGMNIGRGGRNKERTQRQAASYLTACGLAMRRFVR
jgi:type IV pilus assembly protein PilM